MADAHLGYGLPVGGVLATEGAIIPYAIGVDIACWMRLTIHNAGVGVFSDPLEPVWQVHTSLASRLSIGRIMATSMNVSLVCTSRS
jgi:hypothetical protein